MLVDVTKQQAFTRTVINNKLRTFARIQRLKHPINNAQRNLIKLNK